MKNQNIVSFLILFTCLPTLVHAEKKDKPFPEGVYQERVFLETLPNGKDLYDKDWINRLTIQRLGPTYSNEKQSEVKKYFVSWQYSTYIPAHTRTCLFSGVFEQEKDRLRLTREYRNAMKCDVYLTIDKNKILVHDRYLDDSYDVRQTNPNTGCQNYCEGAGIKGIFPLKNKVKR